MLSTVQRQKIRLIFALSWWHAIAIAFMYLCTCFMLCLFLLISHLGKKFMTKVTLHNWIDMRCIQCSPKPCHTLVMSFIIDKEGGHGHCPKWDAGSITLLFGKSNVKLVALLDFWDYFITVLTHLENDLKNDSERYISIPLQDSSSQMRIWCGCIQI